MEKKTFNFKIPAKAPNQSLHREYKDATGNRKVAAKTGGSIGNPKKERRLES
jgi:hypothetical protein